MAGHTTGTQPVAGTAATSLAAEAHALVKDVGPAWGLAIIVAVLLLFPRIGLLFHLAQLLKEDRSDKRKHQLEHDKLVKRLTDRTRTSTRKGGPK